MRQSDLRERYSTPVEENDRRFGHGRTHTHQALTDAHSDFVRRAGADGRVPATQIDDTPQRARFAQAKPPRRKHRTQKERLARWHKYRSNKSLIAANQKYVSRAGADGRVPATQIDDTPQRARFAQNRAPKKKYRTQKERMAKGGASRHSNRKVLAAANQKYASRTDADGKIATTTFDETPLRARFARTKGPKRGKHVTQKERQNRARLRALLDHEDRMHEDRRRASSRASSVGASSSSMASSSVETSSSVMSSSSDSSWPSSSASGGKRGVAKPAATFEQELTAVAEGEGERTEEEEEKEEEEEEEVVDEGADEGTDDGAEEGEDMPSGEDAEAAASKLQARMRGKAARQGVAELKALKASDQAAGGGGPSDALSTDSTPPSRRASSLDGISPGLKI